MKRAYKFRVYPNKNQEVKLNRTLDTCRHLYNDSLAERKRQAELNRLFSEFQVFPWGKPEWTSYEDQANELASSKTSFQKEVHSQVLQNVLKRLDKSFKNASINILNRSTAGTAGRACQGCLDGESMQQEASLIEGR